MTIRRMTCCICGSDAGRWQQHWNRDDGYGVCIPCIEWVRQRGRKMPIATEAEIENLYGKEGVNWGHERPLLASLKDIAW